MEDGRAVKIEGLESHPLNKGKLCPKGENALESIYSPDRIKQPLKRVNGGFEAVSWDQALDEIAGKLDRLREEFGPQIRGVFSGSIGVESLAGYYFELNNEQHDLYFSLLSAIEETLELSGSVSFVYAALTHLASSYSGL